MRVPPLDALDRLAARSILGSIVLLTLGIGVGAARFERGDFDAAMAVTLVIVAHYARCSSSGTRAGAAAGQRSSTSPASRSSRSSSL